MLSHLLFFLALATALNAAESFRSPEHLWKDFDPRKDPLQKEILRQWEEDGCRLEEFYFTGLSHEGTPVRVYAIYGAPLDGKKLPAVLHIHGGGQTAYLGWVKYWNQQGYAAMTYNWGGRWENRPRYTDWGKLKQGNHLDVGPMLQAVEPTPKLSSWYLWTALSRRALTALEQQPEVDPERLGIFGISMGGTITWPMAAMDKRVKAACAIYGVGWNSYPDSVFDPDPSASKPDVVEWRKLMEPESYARLIECPILFLNASNDQHGKMDWTFKTTSQVPGEHREAVTPRFRHHIAQDQGTNLFLWMDRWLKGNKKIQWPQTPRIQWVVKKGQVPALEVKPSERSSIKRVEVFYGIENTNPKNRFWRTAKVLPGRQAWKAELPIMSREQVVVAFANVFYESGVCLTSKISFLLPDALREAQVTDRPSRLIDDFTGGVDGWVTSSPGTDPLPPIRSVYHVTQGPGNQPGIGTTIPISLSTHKIGDPKWRGPEGSSLVVRYYVPKERPLQVVVHEKEFMIGWTSYTNRVQAVGSDHWQEIRLRVEDFTGPEGKKPKAWQDLNMLEFLAPGGEPQPIYGRVEWGE